jgi:hypothetical protein
VKFDVTTLAPASPAITTVFGEVIWAESMTFVRNVCENAHWTKRRFVVCRDTENTVLLRSESGPVLDGEEERAVMEFRQWT